VRYDFIATLDDTITDREAVPIARIFHTESRVYDLQTVPFQNGRAITLAGHACHGIPAARACTIPVMAREAARCVVGKNANTSADRVGVLGSLRARVTVSDGQRCRITAAAKIGSLSAPSRGGGDLSRAATDRVHLIINTVRVY
jgi:hypothetical protein